MEKKVRESFFLFLNNELSIDDFESWVYGNHEVIEESLGEDVSLEFLEFNYKDWGEINSLLKLVKKQISLPEFEKWRILRCLARVETRGPQSADAIMFTYHLYCKGYAFLQDLGLTYGLCLVVPTSKGKDCWTELTSQEQVELTDMMYPQIVGEARKVISWIEEGKIVLTGGTADYGDFTY